MTAETRKLIELYLENEKLVFETWYTKIECRISWTTLRRRHQLKKLSAPSTISKPETKTSAKKTPLQS